MLSGHENANPTSEPDFRELAHENARMEGAGFTQQQSDIAETGIDLDRVPYPKPHRPIKHRTHRGGRSHTEASEKESDPNFHVQAHPLTPEEIAERQAVRAGPGYREAMAVGVEIAHRAVRNATDGLPENYRIARELAAIARRERDRS